MCHAVHTCMYVHLHAHIHMFACFHVHVYIYIHLYIYPLTRGTFSFKVLRCQAKSWQLLRSISNVIADAKSHHFLVSVGCCCCCCLLSTCCLLVVNCQHCFVLDSLALSLLAVSRFSPTCIYIGFPSLIRTLPK